MSLDQAIQDLAVAIGADIKALQSSATDHGALTGLADDDHQQYALADGTRGDFAPTAHDHDDLYPTKAEAVTALAGKANSTHNHTLDQLPAGVTLYTSSSTTRPTTRTDVLVIWTGDDPTSNALDGDLWMAS